jgi:transposase
MRKRNLYAARSQEVRECFERAGGPDKVLVVPMDLAKQEHMAMLCLGNGECLCRAFAVRNSPEGADYLVGRIDGLRRQRGIGRENVLIGGEDPAEYTFNFIHRIRLDGFAFLRVNAAQASKLRNNSRAVSDVLALDGIGQALIQQRGRLLETFDGLYSSLKGAARDRRRLVCEETAWKNRIHRSVEILFPGFLDREQTGIVPFSSASLALLEEDFSCLKIKRCRLDTLVRQLQRHGAQKPEGAAVKLKALADRVLAPPPGLIAAEAIALSTKVRMLRAVREAIAMEENQMAGGLVQTPGFYLTSIPGLGVVLAAHIMAEYGCPDRWPAADNMASYAGIVPRQTQTGGPSQPARTGHLPLDANRILKDYLLQAAFHAGTTGQHRLQEHYRQVELRDGKSRLSTAKLLVRILRRMALTETVYLPLEILRPGLPLPEGYVVAYYREVTAKLVEKWKPYDLSGIDPQANRLQQWKETVDDIARASIATV